MSERLMSKVKMEAIHAFGRGKRMFKLFGVEFKIQYAHHNEYQVLLPDGYEIIRLYDNGCGKVAAAYV